MELQPLRSPAVGFPEQGRAAGLLQVVVKGRDHLPHALLAFSVGEQLRQAGFDDFLSITANVADMMPLPMRMKLGSSTNVWEADMMGAESTLVPTGRNSLH